MGRLFRTRAAALAVAILAGALTAPAAQQPDDPGEPRTEAALTILQLNDVYSTVPVDGAGGLARVATLKQRLTRDGVAPLMLMAGDFLSSSVASTTTLHGSSRLTVRSSSSARWAKFGLQAPRILRNGRSTPSLARNTAATSISVSTPKP